MGRDHRDRGRAGRSPTRCASSSADGGRLVIPVGDRRGQELLLVSSGAATSGSSRPTGRACSCRSSGGRASPRLTAAGGGTGPLGILGRPWPTSSSRPIPDDVALSCGGLIASLRELGQNVTIITVFSGDGAGERPRRSYQREALGFGSKAMWPVTEAFNRAHIAADHAVYARTRCPRGPRPTPSSRRPRPTPTRPRSGSGSARRGTAGRASAPSRWPASRSWTTCRRRARS